jgi:hypothetical protein
VQESIIRRDLVEEHQCLCPIWEGEHPFAGGNVCAPIAMQPTYATFEIREQRGCDGRIKNVAGVRVALGDT